MAQGRAVERMPPLVNYLEFGSSTSVLIQQLAQNDSTLQKVIGRYLIMGGKILFLFFFLVLETFRTSNNSRKVTQLVLPISTVTANQSYFNTFTEVVRFPHLTRPSIMV